MHPVALAVSPWASSGPASTPIGTSQFFNPSNFLIWLISVPGVWIPMKTMRSPNFSCTFLSAGIACTHPLHQTPQKSTSTTFPWKSESLRSFPSVHALMLHSGADSPGFIAFGLSAPWAILVVRHPISW